MNIVFVAPRYHTNQIHLLEELNKEHNVSIFVQTLGFTEYYINIYPQKIKKSLFTLILHALLYKKDIMGLKRQKYFIPSIFWIISILIKIKPAILVLRDRCISTIYIYFIAKFIFNKKVILYNQAPTNEIKELSFRSRFVRYLTPKIRMSPVYNKSGKKNNLNCYYIPFAYPAQKDAENREYFKDDIVNILAIGKFYQRKNHLLLIDALYSLIPNSKFRLTIIGELTNIENENYYTKVKEKVDSYNLNECVKILYNIPYADMHKYYHMNDIFVLASTDEPASISVLEAMGHGMCVISSDNNGTSCYINDTNTGYIFKNNDINELSLTLTKAINDRTNTVEIGRKAYYYVKAYHNPSQVAKEFLSLKDVNIIK